MLDRLHTGDELRIALCLNGVGATVDVHPFDSLACTLRDRLGLTGTKIGCDAGDCGACTVIMNGEQVCACLVASAQADGADIVTVEADDINAHLPRLRAAFLAEGAAQCGICTPGMLMAAASLLARNGRPDERQVRDALGGVLCRCTGYQKIVEAVLAAAHGTASLAEADPGTGGAVGARVPRADGEPKLCGTERFGADVAPADALWLRPIRSPHARATFTLGDLNAFVADHPGIVAVLTAKDVPGHNGFGIFPHLREQPVFSVDRVRYRGETVLAIVGERAAVEAINVADAPVTWHSEEPVTGIVGARAGSLSPVHDSHPDNVLITGLVEKGDVAAGHAAAAASATGTFSTSFVEHAYIEPEAGFARICEDDPDRIEVVACTQAPYMDRDEIANVLGFDRERVRIIPSACGGGFGGKLDVSVQPMLAVAAWVLKRPVRTVWSRIESMASSTKRHPSRITATMSAAADGRLTAYEMTGDFNTGAYSSWGPTVAGRVPVHATGPYKVANVLARSAALYTNEPPSGAFRGFGVPQAAFAHETLLDDLAEQLGIDRLEIRHRNAIRAGDATATGQVLEHSCGLAECLDALRSDWQAMLARCAEHNAKGGRVRRGAGVGCMWYGCGNTSMSNPSSMRVTLGTDGRLTLYNGAVDIGQGSATIMLQICADALGLPMAAFDQVVGDTDRTADAGKTSASRQTLVSGKAAYLAGLDLRRGILALANAGSDAQLRLDGARLDVIDGELRRSIDLGTLDAGLEGFGTYDPPATALDAKGQGSPYATYGFAAQICELTVDLELGTVKVETIVAAHDVGRAINPTLVEGQIHGGIAQGLGMALMEEYIPGRTENLHDYLIPTFGDMPRIEVRIIEDAEPEGPYGAKGIGEPALVPTPPAITGAIRHATGVTMRHLPALPHRIWAALNETGIKP
jgi:aldehyde oxidoreductase